MESHFRENQERQIIKNLHVKTQSHLTALLGVLAINAALLFLRGGVPAQAGPPAPGALSHPGAAMSAAESQLSRPAPSRAEAAPPRPAGMPAAARLTVGGDDPYVFALAMSGTNLYAGGSFNGAGGSPANYLARWDGSSWSTVGGGVNYHVRALWASGSRLYVGGGARLVEDGRPLVEANGVASK